MNEDKALALPYSFLNAGTGSLDSLMCLACSHTKECQPRQDTEPWMFSDQYQRCMETEVPDYKDDDYWILKACLGEGQELTAEEILELKNN